MANNNQIEVNGIDIKYKKINKADFKGLEFTTFENQAGKNSFW